MMMNIHNTNNTNKTNKRKGSYKKLISVLLSSILSLLCYCGGGGGGVVVVVPVSSFVLLVNHNNNKHNNNNGLGIQKRTNNIHHPNRINRNNNNNLVHFHLGSSTSRHNNQKTIWLLNEKKIDTTNNNNYDNYENDNNNNKEAKLRRESIIRNGLLVDDDDRQQHRNNFIINTITGGLLILCSIAFGYLFQTTIYTPNGFTRYSSTQYIAALGHPNANSGNNANTWGIWQKDPGPRGVYIRDYKNQLEKNNYIQPVYQWIFNPNDWWVEEHGILMESPQFPIQPGHYLVTGGRFITTGLTIKKDGTWKFDDDKTTLYDVTHLPCRSARYTTPITTSTSSSSTSSSSSNTDNNNNWNTMICLPTNANLQNFPVTPGAEMPPIQGCNKQDYAVLFLLGEATTTQTNEKLSNSNES